MPFTLTHIAAAVPFAWLSRWRLPFSALAIGCMVCDMGVFYPALFPYIAMHSVRGIFTHCLPLGIALHFIYQFVLKEPLVGLLPEPIRLRLAPLAGSRPGFSFASILAIAVCVVIGASTHIFWDSFTHWGRWGVQQIPILSEVAFQSGGRYIHWYAIAQHASSVIVLPPMIILFVRWIFRQPAVESAEQKWRISPKVTAMAVAYILLYAIIHFAIVYHNHAADYGTMAVLRSTVKYTGAISFTLMIAYGLIANLMWNRKNKA